MSTSSTVAALAAAVLVLGAPASPAQTVAPVERHVEIRSAVDPGDLSLLLHPDAALVATTVEPVLVPGLDEDTLRNLEAALDGMSASSTESSAVAAIYKFIWRESGWILVCCSPTQLSSTTGPAAGYVVEHGESTLLSGDAMPAVDDAQVRIEHVTRSGTLAALEGPDVLALTALVGKVATDGPDLAARVGRALHRAYGLAVVPGTAAHMEYLVRWCPETMSFKVVCIETSTWIVELPAEGAVHVTARTGVFLTS